MEISIDYESFAPIMDLPPPPKKMLEEAEKEEANYLREMLEKVLTIREAKCIRLAIWEKIHRHPIVQGIYDLCDRRRDETKPNQVVFGEADYYRNDNPYFLQDIFDRQKRRIRTLMDSRFYRVGGKSKHALFTFRDENCKYLRGKNKGKINEKWWELASLIYDKWIYATQNCVMKKRNVGFWVSPSNYRYFTADELYRLGFWNFMLFNHKKNRNKPRFAWEIEMPS